MITEEDYLFDKLAGNLWKIFLYNGSDRPEWRTEHYDSNYSQPDKFLRVSQDLWNNRDENYKEYKYRKTHNIFRKSALVFVDDIE